MKRVQEVATELYEVTGIEIARGLGLDVLDEAEVDIWLHEGVYNLSVSHTYDEDVELPSSGMLEISTPSMSGILYTGAPSYVTTNGSKCDCA